MADDPAVAPDGDKVFQAALRGAAAGLQLVPNFEKSFAAKGLNAAGRDRGVAAQLQWRALYRRPKAGVSIVFPEAAGLVVIDIDVKNGAQGLGSMARLGLTPENDFGAAPYIERTPSGGYHAIYQMPEGQYGAEGLEGFTVSPHTSPGLELRHGPLHTQVAPTPGYVRLKGDLFEPASLNGEIPPVLLAAFRKPAPRPQPAAPVLAGSGTGADRIIEREVRKLASACDAGRGGRDIALNNALMTCAGVAHRSSLDEAEIKARLAAAAASFLSEEPDKAEKFDRVWRDGLAKPLNGGLREAPAARDARVVERYFDGAGGLRALLECYARRRWPLPQDPTT